jgi:Rod binding domain-containing protein
MEYGQEIFAQSMASSGGLGLANMVAKGIGKIANPNPSQ